MQTVIPASQDCCEGDARPVCAPAITLLSSFLSPSFSFLQVNINDPFACCLDNPNILWSNTLVLAKLDRGRSKP